MKNFLGFARLALGAIAVVSPVFATPLALSFDGDALVSSTSIEFMTSPYGGSPVPAPGSGEFVVVDPVKDIFASKGVAAGALGNIMSLDASMETPGAAITPPLLFMTFQSTPTLDIYLTKLDQGTLPHSPFTITTDSNGFAEALFSVHGFLLDTSTNTAENYTGTFSATFNGLTPTQLIGSLPVTTGFTASLSLTPVPEPASILLAGLGLLGAGLIARRRKASR